MCLSPTNGFFYVLKCVGQKDLTAMKGPAGVSRQWYIWAIHRMQVTKAHKSIVHPWFETQFRHHQKFKTGVPVTPQKRLKFSKLLNENTDFYCCFVEHVFHIYISVRANGLCFEVKMKRKVLEEHLNER